jgi:hypothetical protein
MAGDWSHNATFDEVVQLMENEESYVRIFGLPHRETTRTWIDLFSFSLSIWISFLRRNSE